MGEKSNQLDAFIDSSAQVLGIALEPEWKAPVRANLEVAFRLAALIGEKELPDDAEPAPVYRA